MESTDYNIMTNNVISTIKVAHYKYLNIKEKKSSWSVQYLEREVYEYITTQPFKPTKI
jgi:hypothetical protein